VSRFLGRVVVGLFLVRECEVLFRDVAVVEDCAGG
jgi:hypothetical protein